ncbi:RNA 2',3'-cyclic phosphodiesterase, partial [Methanocalculus sp.]|uniref:RNA 2',3'-cyclic phosphodiesterase n=1 Tax=Methanocalculus sp. TaxID=2004547 RepID=UPI00261D7C58
MVRAFIAIDLPASLQEALSLVQEPLHKAPGRLAIVDPSLLHITLKFLGELSPDQVARVIEELKSLEFPAYPVSIRGISANNPTRPRVIWAKVQDEGKTAALAGLIDSALETIGVSRETRPFCPHITIARV